ncbi:MAG: alpha-amylase/4-alpha-glucanotransferase domain-containing protein [Candidatus Acidiferrales bacterium]
MPKFQLVLLIHAHQPIGNFDDVFERSYARSYLPFIEVLSKRPSIRAGLHYSGSLLEWIERWHPEYFERLRALVRSGQVEMVGGGFYEPILIAIPPQDRFEQITRLADYIEEHFQKRPRGAWLTERVWEPQIPSFLAPAGVEYTLVDDNHFIGAGFELDQLYGYYLAEDLRRTVKIFPGLQRLRYLIPFRDARETIQFLREAAEAHPGGLAAMGDDLEKFGGWPGTHEHCYRHGWLEHFFSELEECSEWLEVVTPSNAVDSRVALGRADLPVASYTEMMEWALPTPARNRYHELVEEFASRPEALSFLRGGVWRNFFSKYSESNLLHKKMLHVSEKVQQLALSNRSEAGFQEALEQAKTLLLRGQCNDAYWHGVFGGLYAPHLRTAVWRSLVQAESIADRLTHPKSGYAQAARFDFDSDGNDEIYFTSEKYAALVAPADGGTVPALDFRSSDAALINSLRRRPEAYHGALRPSSASDSPSVQSIHQQRRSKEEGLERWLNYDRWFRNAFRLLIFAKAKTHEDCAAARLEEDAALAGGRYRVTGLSSTCVALTSEEGTDWLGKKALSLQSTKAGFDAMCSVALRRTATSAASVNVGIEMIVNFLAPSAPDRYFQSDGKRFPLRWSVAAPAADLRVVDEWQRIGVTLRAPGARSFWIAPIETVSESEEGYERIYQGSQVIAVWPVELAANEEWKGQMTLRVERLP